VERETRAESRTEVRAVQSVLVPMWSREEAAREAEEEVGRCGGEGKEEEGRRKVVLMQPVARAVGVRKSTRGTACSLTVTRKGTGELDVGARELEGEERRTWCRQTRS
jgi:hypothetical protein